jgi:hypothetical protein
MSFPVSSQRTFIFDTHLDFMAIVALAHDATLPPSTDLRSEVCFVACHPAAGTHFADFFFELHQLGRVSCRMVATEKAAEELEKRHVPFQNFYEGKKAKALRDLSEKEQDELAISVAKICRHARCVIIDVGTEFSTKVQTKLAELYPSIVRIAYYDNPEPFVPGGYSATAAKVMQKAQIVLFANAKLAEATLYPTSDSSKPFDFQGKQKVGLGYANLRDIEELLEKRKPATRIPLQAALFNKQGLNPKTIATLAVYFGGANEIYYQQAFPRFLEILTAASKTEDLSNLAIVIQQHPRSVLEGNRDGTLLEKWNKTASKQSPKVVLSLSSFNDALVSADLALYYQTGAATRFMLAGVPTAQIGHEPYHDTLIRNGFCQSVTDEKQFLQLLDDLCTPPIPNEEVRKKIAQESGIDPAWPKRLASLLDTLAQ